MVKSLRRHWRALNDDPDDYLVAFLPFRVPWRKLPWVLWALTLAVLLWVVGDVFSGGRICDW